MRRIARQRRMRSISEGAPVAPRQSRAAQGLSAAARI